MKEYVYFEGRFKWCRDKSPDPWGNWKTDFYPNEGSLVKWQALQAQGIKNKLRKDEEGYNFTLRRPQQKKGRDGKIFGFTPPIILDGKKPLPSGGFEPLAPGTMIGNGSTGEVKVEVYSYTNPMSKLKEKAIRWEAARIDDLIPFEKDKDFTQDENKAASGLDERPQQLW